MSTERETPITKEAYKQRDGEGALDHAIRMAKTMERLECERAEARDAYEAETLSTAELMAVNSKLSYALHRIANSDSIKWDADNQQEYEREFTPWAKKIAREAFAQEGSLTPAE